MWLEWVRSRKCDSDLTAPPCNLDTVPRPSEQRQQLTPRFLLSGQQNNPELRSEVTIHHRAACWPFFSALVDVVPPLALRARTVLCLGTRTRFAHGRWARDLYFPLLPVPARVIVNH